ncbi:MAG: hypothetical protein IKS32_12920, partial [Solobacterium sp.]|nr:hypothetical protein [Solobacterium sp.]
IGNAPPKPLYHNHTTHTSINLNKFDMKKAAVKPLSMILIYRNCRKPAYEQNKKNLEKLLAKAKMDKRIFNKENSD